MGGRGGGGREEGRGGAYGAMGGTESSCPNARHLHSGIGYSPTIIVTLEGRGVFPSTLKLKSSED